MQPTDRYQWIFERSPVMVVLFDPQGRFEDVSDAFAGRLGYDKAELIGRMPSDIASPESVQRITSELQPKLRRLGQVRDQPVEFLDAEGDTVELLASALTEHDAAGDTVHTLAVYAEISEHALIEKKYRRLYRQTPAMLHTIDRDRKITAVSDHWLQKMGYESRSEILGRSILEFFTPEYRESIDKVDLAEIMSSGGLINVERQMIRSDGSIIDVVVSSLQQSDSPRGVSRMLVASKDVTERNRQERALRAALAENARLREELEHERDYLREEISVAMNFGRIVGESPALSNMLKQMQAVARTPANVLILGESGVGKELIAHALHAQSDRAEAPLVKVNCATVPKELFESEFFGHVKGAFTGAVKDRVGRFQLADGGTIFLDEVGEIPLELQSKLLRVLQEQEFERVGDDQTRKVDVRIVAATNRDLEALVEAGQFREDLYYRLSVFPIEAPPLRKRGDDIVQLAQHFLDQTCRDFGRERIVLNTANIEALRGYDWPGNVRELKNVVERAVILSPNTTLRLDLSMTAMPHADTHVTGTADKAIETRRDFVTEREMREHERRNTQAALRAANGRVSGPGGAAELLGLRPTTLADRVKRMGLDRASH